LTLLAPGVQHKRRYKAGSFFLDATTRKSGLIRK
jgi:hypothetical protein